MLRSACAISRHQSRACGRKFQARTDVQMQRRALRCGGADFCSPGAPTRCADRVSVRAAPATFLRFTRSFQRIDFRIAARASTARGKSMRSRGTESSFRGAKFLVAERTFVPAERVWSQRRALAFRGTEFSIERHLLSSCGTGPVPAFRVSKSPDGSFTRQHSHKSRLTSRARRERRPQRRIARFVPLRHSP
jgi:hypothetical protein